MAEQAVRIQPIIANYYYGVKSYPLRLGVEGRKLEF